LARGAVTGAEAATSTGPWSGRSGAAGAGFAPLLAGGTGTPGIFGLGEGRWGTNDENLISVNLVDASPGGASADSNFAITDLPSRVEVVSVAIVANDLQIVVKNKGGAMGNGATLDVIVNWEGPYPR